MPLSLPDVRSADANEATAVFVAAFFAELLRSGVQHVCICPGSRSTPLTLAACRTAGLQCSSHHDERSAGFFALGLARAAARPVALIATSGTAVANFLPAVVEAHYARVPLLLLTADRPPELRDWGAGQTIDRDLSFTHTFQKSRLGPRRGPIDLVSKQDVGEDRTTSKFKFSRLLIEDIESRDIARQQIRRALDAGKPSRNCFRDGLC